jgi:hypothetical protein
MSEVNPVLPDDVIVEVRQFMSEVIPILPEDVIVEVSSSRLRSLLFYLTT